MKIKLPRHKEAADACAKELGLTYPAYIRTLVQADLSEKPDLAVNENSARLVAH